MGFHSVHVSRGTTPVPATQLDGVAPVAVQPQAFVASGQVIGVGWK